MRLISLKLSLVMTSLQTPERAGGYRIHTWETQSMKIGLSLTCALFLALAVQTVNAAEPAKATTDELPAALKALGADAGRALTTTDAGAIRGEGGGGWLWLNAAPVAMYNGFGVQNFGGNIYISGKNVMIGSKNKFSSKGHHH
jgi:hypothetical protein